MAEVRLQAITKRFKQTEILNGIDLTIAHGEFFTLAGPSGCGKSTLLNLIAGLEPPTSGSVFFDGADVTGLPPGERDIAFVFQSYALYPHLSVFENLAFPLRIRKMKEARIREAVEEAARQLGLAGLLDRYPKALSGGQRQRVALGRAIVRRPRLFLLDEPLSNLDALLRIEMRSEIKQLHRRLGATIIYVTHDQAEAMILSDRIAVMEAGRIRQCAPPEEIYRRPANRFVAGFIGTPPMNFVRGKVNRGNRGMVLFDGGAFPLPKVHQAALSPEIPDREIILGFRPEEITLSLKPISGAAQGTIALLEPVGSETGVVFTLGSQTFRGKGPADFPLRPGDPVWVVLHPENLHFFDPGSGERLTGPI